MPKSVGKKLLYIILILLVLVAAGAGISALWLSRHYKQIIVKEMPGIMAKVTDSIYQITFKDIDVNVFTHNVTITGIKLWPDHKQAKALRARHHKIPPTLSTLSISSLEASGIDWNSIVSTKSIACKSAVIHDLKWLMVCAPHPEDSLFEKDKKGTPFLQSIRSDKIDFIHPDITYHYEGKKDSFFFFVSGGHVTLNDWIYNYDQQKDTSLFLYAHSGKVRFDNLVFLKKNGRYTVKRPDLDFETSPNSVSLKQVRIKNMVNHNPQTGAEKEIYNVDLPLVKLNGLNWNDLISGGALHATEIEGMSPDIEVRYFDKNATTGNRKGSYPHQLLLQVGLQIDLEAVNLQKGHIKYTEVTDKNDEAVIEFTNIRGKLTNITNMKDVIARHKACVIKLDGKFMGKSEVTSTFNFILTDNTGRFSMDGTLSNLDGDDVVKQTQAFTFVEVTSFHLDKMDMHIAGDESYAKGNFTVLYKDLKISLLKFKSKHRTGRKGPLSFLGSTLILYPSNPVKDKDVRTVTTSFARDTTKGFVSVLWKNIYRAAKKTAVRDEGLIELTDGPESVKGEHPEKKSFFKRLFGKKDR